ncbi:MAG: pyruvate formate lyase family protein [Desulfocucumaceae bacterium]
MISASGKAGIKSMNVVIYLLLRAIAFSFNHIPRLNRYLKTDEGWLEFSVGIKTESGTVAQSVFFKDGRVRVQRGVPGRVGVELTFINEETLKQFSALPPNEIVNLILKNKLIIRGNLVYLQLFTFLLSLINKNRQVKQMALQARELKKLAQREAPPEKMPAKTKKYMRAGQIDPGVKYLEDPYLSEYSLDNFSRLKHFLDIHFNHRPEICIERARLLTKWYKENGFETDRSGNRCFPELRQGYAYKYLMENKKPIIRKNDLIAGTTTSREIGIVLYPDSASASMLWGELLTGSHRNLQPFNVAPEDIAELHHNIFPWWAERNFKQYVKNKYNEPLCQQVDDRFAVNFLWKTVALSHTILDYPKLLRRGARGIIEECEQELKEDSSADQARRDTLKAIILCYEGIITYAGNLSRQAKQEAAAENDPLRRAELEKLAQVCERVPEHSCRTLDEAVNAIWIHWVAVHNENTNAGFSLGRMDQWLQPYFASDMEKLQTEEEKKAFIRHAIELVGCIYMRCTDHLPALPDVGNYLFGGSSSDQAITLGGVTPEGEDAVNDMTYIFLKVTEMLAIRDPNVNARYNNKKNSQSYLRRLCEVNYNTTATPSIHNDEIVMASLQEFNYPPEHIRDWAATGCVEPTISGRHIGHTNCMMFNMVAALEMALYNGYHPLMRWHLGPNTGDIQSGAFPTFDHFFEAFATQINYLAGLSCEYNKLLGEAHSVLRPTPMISGMVEGCIKKGRDVTKGGALYNTSGAACIGLADITDSLMVIKKLVYDEKKVSFAELQDTVAGNFANHPKLHAMVMNRVPLFGSGDDEAVEMANRVTRMVHDIFAAYRNFRGGPYTVGFWSMSNHTAFGALSGALPSGRLAGKPFTPGLTPQSHASKSLLDNIRDVARLQPANMNNNIAFNVKVVPGPRDTHEEVVEQVYSYVKAYCDLGGMQMQLNVVSTDTLRDAMARPEEYKSLMVRISGYNAYFVTLDRSLQLELIERAEYGL